MVPFPCKSFLSMKIKVVIEETSSAKWCHLLQPFIDSLVLIALNKVVVCSVE